MPLTGFMTYRKILLLSPGLIQLRKGFWVNKYPGLRGVAYSVSGQKCFRTSHGSKLKSHHKATFSPVQYCHLAEGRERGGGTYNQISFFLSS